jgi:hypothetical protein
MGYNSAAVGKLGSNFPLPPSRKESFIYDDQNKDFHRFVTLVPGGHGDPLSYYRGSPHLRFAAEAAMVQECCGGDLWRIRDGLARIFHENALASASPVATRLERHDLSSSTSLAAGLASELQ